MRRIVFLVALLVVQVVLFPSLSRAGSVTITTTSPTSLTVTEGGSAIIVDFTFTNNTGATLLGTLFQGGFTTVSGDLTDYAQFSYVPGGCLNFQDLSMPIGASCTLSISISSPAVISSGETEMPTDSGITDMDIDLVYSCPNCLDDTDPIVIIAGEPSFDPFFSFSVTATDATPEPSSLLLLGTGLLGIGPLIRRFTIS